MLGNLWEYTADRWGEYSPDPVTDPKRPLTAGRVVIRGGGQGPARELRSATRYHRSTGNQSYFTGFRLVRTMPTWTNTLGMEFVWIRQGTFQMGFPDTEKGRSNDEIQHPVTIGRGYWLGKHEVTRREWHQVVGSYPPAPPYCDAEFPVGSVSWDETQEFIRRLNAKESALGYGYSYRLPTEAEWEYAARAGTTGARYGALDAIAWHAANSDGKLTQVGYKQANAWGVHDMLGNVGEWNADWYAAYRSYHAFSAVDPQGPSKGSLRVFRGGSFNDVAGGVRSADRRNGLPSAHDDTLGFRLVMTSYK